MRKGKQRKQNHAQDSFKNLLAQQTLQKFAPFIHQQVNQTVDRILNQRLENVYMRLVAIEEILMEEVEGLTKDVLADRVSIIQDRAEGYEPAEEVELGDRVRVEIQTKTEDQDEFQGSTRLLIDNAGSGNTLGKQIEEALPGMKPGESKEVKFGAEDKMTAKILLSKVSRSPKVEQADPLAEAAAEADAEASTEENNDTNEG